MKMFKNIEKLCWLNVSVQILIFIIVASSIFILFSSASKGFDITDESYYLLSASQPQNSFADMSHFGYVLTYLYALAGKNIALYRVLGMLFLFCAGLAFSFSFEKYWQSWSNTENNCRLNISLILPGSVIVLIYYGQWWLLTPSYNWLALVAVLLAGTGLLYGFINHDTSQITKNSLSNIWAGSLLVGFGGALAFLAKPPAAALLALTVVLWVCCHWQNNKKIIFLLFAALTALVLLSLHARINFGGYWGFYKNLQESFAFAATLSEGLSLFEISQTALSSFIDFFALISHLLMFQIIFFLAVIFLIIGLAKPIKKMSSLISYTLTSVILFFWLLLILLQSQYGSSLGLSFFKQNFISLNIGSSLLMIYILLFVSATCIHVVDRRLNVTEIISYPRLAMLYTFLLLLTISFAYGSSNEILRQFSGASYFFMLGIFYISAWMINRHANNVLINLIVLAGAINLLCLFLHGYDNPYRLVGNIGNQKSSITLLPSSGTLYVDKKTANYVNSLKSQALAAGWLPNTPLIDMTGATPGALVILNARILGKAWLLGGYSGSNKFASMALKSVSIDLLEKAWVLTSVYKAQETPVDGRQALDSHVLNALHLSFPNNYTLVGEYKTGYRHETQQLWKPKKREN